MNAYKEKIKVLLNIGQPEATTRNQHIDAMKGVAIILVVFGHSIQINDPNFDNNLLFRIIYSFHMPLFMFLSGLIFSKQLVSSVVAYLKKNSMRLVLPFIVWHLISFVVLRFSQDVNLFDYMFELAKHPGSGLWFLWVLFINSTILFLTLKLVQQRPLLLRENYSVIVVLLLTRTFSSDILGLAMVRQYFPYYVAGFFVCKYIDVLKNKRNILYIISLLFPLLAISWKRNAFPTFYPFLVQFLNDQHIARLIVSIYKYAAAFSGITFVSFVLGKINAPRIYAALCWLGTFTFGIYVCHGYFLIKFSNGASQYLSTFIVAITISLALVILLKRLKITRRLLLGQIH